VELKPILHRFPATLCTDFDEAANKALHFSGTCPIYWDALEKILRDGAVEALESPVLGEVTFRLEAPRLRTRPFLKWAGGKTRLLPVLRQSVPDKAFRRYIEPFLGGGALFFDLAPDAAVLSDSNPELISCYEVVRDAPEELIKELSHYSVSEAEFYRIRGLRPLELSPIERAARFIYLNKTCYNGVYRVNKNGDFNTPFGHYTNVSLVDEANLRRASELLKNAVLRCQDYQSVLSCADKNDFVYFDPPYMPVGKYSDFKRYTREFFYEADHERLAQVYSSLAKKGCFVLLSNSYHERIADLYSDFVQTKVQVPRFVNCKGDGRGDVAELLISNYTPAMKKGAA
jgi:DNA adenine methylase